MLKCGLKTDFCYETFTVSCFNSQLLKEDYVKTASHSIVSLAAEISGSV